MDEEEYIAHSDFDPDGSEDRINSNFATCLRSFEHNPTQINAALLQISVYQMKWEYDDTNEFGNVELLESINIWKELDDQIDDICRKYLDIKGHEIYCDFNEILGNFEKKQKPTYIDASMLQIALSHLKWDSGKLHKLEHKVIIESKAVRKTFDRILKKICLKFLRRKRYHKDEGKRSGRICINALKDADKAETARKNAADRSQRKEAVQAFVDAGYALAYSMEDAYLAAGAIMDTKVGMEVMRKAYHSRK